MNLLEASALINEVALFCKNYKFAALISQSFEENRNYIGRIILFGKRDLSIMQFGQCDEALLVTYWFSVAKLVLGTLENQVGLVLIVFKCSLK